MSQDCDRVGRTREIVELGASDDVGPLRGLVERYREASAEDGVLIGVVAGPVATG